MLISATMVLGVLGIFLFFLDLKPPPDQGSGTPLQAAARAARYEAVIANWNRYRAKGARAEVR